ncbi:hypothetical protein N780_01310 [Pontibacillus chungwhensis BH030062]|uniref:Extracellular protein n=1 Tax=Pontibacillus chungwhensis BH030062 TaxID=1385513 RepID=A0A0A2UWB7_9BACI|nr:DUF1002 domain-containing protein [Pontibacillus chungwhensis]KGP92224.1 hypothetical protein N780_01310 [Pontibacillus chungwhensis BH030062]
MKRWFSFIAVIILLSLSVSTSVSASTSINEKLGVPIVVYGETLTDAQQKEVRNQLEVEDRDSVDEYSVNGQDIANYIGGNPNSRMYSSVKITPEEEGTGLTVNLVTPDNITQVTKEMYKNALLTAGVSDATVDVASPVKVSGHSALTGIYKAYDEKGVKLDSDRMKVASEELDVATKLAEESGVSKEKVSQLISQIKKEIAEQNPATREEVERIVQNQLDSLNINLNPEDVELLTNLFDQIRSLNINFDELQKQLEDITASAKELLNDEGFWNSVANFFEKILNAISDLISSLINGLRSIFA